MVTFWTHADKSHSTLNGEISNIDDFENCRSQIYLLTRFDKSNETMTADKHQRPMLTPGLPANVTH